MGHPGGTDAGIVAAVGVQHGPLVEGHEIRVKSGQGDALVRQPDLAGRLAKSSCGWPLPATARPVRARTSPEYGDRSHRGGGHAVQPEFFGGHALHGFAVGGFAGKQRTFGMAVPVDEAGAEDAPSRTIVCRESGLVVRGSTAATKPSCTPREPQNHGVPVPSTIRALQKSVSNMGCLAERRGNGPERRGEPPILSVRPAGNYGVGPCGGCPTARRNARRRRP